MMNPPFDLTLLLVVDARLRIIIYSSLASFAKRTLMTNLIGQSLGRYHILEQLGEGGMATVYKAYDTRLEADVAVKVIRTEQLPPVVLERALKRFEREAKALARLTHPNIVKVSDYGEYEGRPYLVMPFLPGGTLKSQLSGRPMPWDQAARLLVPVARGLDYAHRQGLIHRDVKPSNILITEDSEPVLTDFGIAKIIDDEATSELTGTNTTVGTPEYMAPEQVTSKTVDLRADIYALGVVLFEMATGRRPFQADTPMAVLFKHISDPLPRPKDINPDLPDEMEKILLKALAKQPEDRYQSMAEMAAALAGLSGRSATVPVPDDRTCVTIEQPATQSLESHTVIEPRPELTAPAPEPTTPALEGATEKAHPALTWKSGLWTILAWTICMAIFIPKSLSIYTAPNIPVSYHIKYFIGWMLGGILIGSILRKEKLISKWASVLIVAMGCAISAGSLIAGDIYFSHGSINITFRAGIWIAAWSISGLAMGIALFAERVVSRWRVALWITLGYTAGGILAIAVSPLIGYLLYNYVSGILVNKIYEVVLATIPVATGISIMGAVANRNIHRAAKPGAPSRANFTT
jgi:serine/threonine protein kinase